MNALDPSGKGFIEYVWSSIRSTALGVIEGTRVGESALCLLKFVTDVLQIIPVGVHTGIPINANIAEFWEDMQTCLRLAALL